MPGTYSQILLHIVFSTRHREPLITPDLAPRLYDYMGGIIRGEKGTLYAIGGVEDHIHLYLRWRPDKAVSDLMRAVKANSSSWVHETFPAHARHRNILPHPAPVPRSTPPLPTSQKQKPPHSSGGFSFQPECPGEDSNLHALRRYHLKVVRLPVPPPGLSSPFGGRKYRALPTGGQPQRTPRKSRGGASRPRIRFATLSTIQERT